ncbi:hypothetical protein GGR54DRAFT_364765 [Hypoxylon sp. NC1633]|nr:hypothetical protein GGR54DRAFT_364765 [Hypoxylon sp. NC1633]
MESPPWAAAASHEQYFVLLTGANSGVGLGIGQRIIDEFLTTRSLSSHLILIPTTRSISKSRQTILGLRAHLEKRANTSKQLRSRAGPDYNPRSAISRVHMLSVQLDLCSLHSVYCATRQLVHGQLTDPTGLVSDVRIPRIDAAIFNAGIGGWSGLDWLGLAKQFFQQGLVQAVTFPSFKKALPAAVLDPEKLFGENITQNLKVPLPDLAEVFCANVFGHYVFAHEILPLLSRTNPEEPGGRVIWTSSVDAGHDHLKFDDFQARRYMPPYESSKRITDLLSLTADLPSVKKISDPYFNSPSAADKPVKARFYLSHPGVVCTPLFPLNWFCYFAYWCAMYVARWCGSPWHTVELYAGACAATWLALADQESLDKLHAEHVKWGSSVSPLGNTAPKMTEVDRWGWEGKVEDREALENDPSSGFLRKSRGRKRDAVELTDEALIEFEEDGRRCWVELEKLREACEVALGKRDNVVMNGNGTH